MLGVKVGKANGLRLLLDAETFDYTFHKSASEGFKMAVQHHLGDNNLPQCWIIYHIDSNGIKNYGYSTGCFILVCTKSIGSFSIKNRQLSNN